MTAYTFNARVVDLQEIKSRRHIAGVGDDAKFEEQPNGWRVSLVVNESRIGLVFPDKPEFEIGQVIKVVLQAMEKSE